MCVRYFYSTEVNYVYGLMLLKYSSPTESHEIYVCLQEIVEIVTHLFNNLHRIISWKARSAGAFFSWLQRIWLAISGYFESKENFQSRINEVCSLAIQCYYYLLQFSKHMKHSFMSVTRSFQNFPAWSYLFQTLLHLYVTKCLQTI